MQQSAESKHQLRWAAVNYRQQYPSWTDSRIAAKIGKDPNFVKRWTQKYSQQNSVADSPKLGRPQKASTATLKHIVHMADSGSCYSSAGIATQLAHEKGVHLSCSTIARILSAEGFQHMKPQQIPLLTPKHQAARLKFARAVSRVRWNRIMVTDSKYFRLHANSGKQAAIWCRPANRPKLHVTRHSIAVHCYMGITNYGATDLCFVTGTHKQISKYCDACSKKPCSGVGAYEYSDVIKDFLVPEGNRLFDHSACWSDRWMLQQDNATPHMTAQNLKLIDELVPGGRFTKWPSNSPDLSPIENVWSWMDMQLRKRPQCSNVEELKAALIDIRNSIPQQTFVNHFKGMPKRMTDVIAREGGDINK